MIDARDIRVRRGARELLAGVSLTATAGEVVGLIGPNGAGKSTLLRVLSGELIPNSGTVLLQDTPLARWRPEHLARARAVLPQASTLSFPFQVHEVVALGVPGGAAASEIDRRVAEALDTVGLTELAERQFTVLSGGERQRVHFARVLAQLADATPERPAVCLLDEPVAALDPRHQHEVLRCARALADRGIAVIVVLHDLTLAARYTDRLVLLDGGAVAACGSAASVLRSPVLEQAYGVAMTILTDDDGTLIVLPRPAAVDAHV